MSFSQTVSFSESLSFLDENLEVNKMINSEKKEEKRQAILDYAKNVYEREARLVSKREIRRAFHVEIYNYFKNVFDMYQHLGIEVPLEFCPKEYALRKIINFVHIKSAAGLYPTKTEIENELGVHIYTYFNNIKDVYTKSNIDFKFYKGRENLLNGRSNSTENNVQIRKDIVSFIQKNVSKGYYPGVTSIQQELKIAFYRYFNDIVEAYNYAKVKYERPSPILLGKQKEKVLTLVVKELLFRMDYKIKRVSIESISDFNRYADITVEDQKGNKLLVEIKAYQQDYCVTKREFNQLNRYMEREKISKGIFITTSTSCKYSFKNIEFINGNKLRELLELYNLREYINAISWIQESKVNSREREEQRNSMKLKIIDYIKKNNSFPSKKEIENRFKVDIRTYFGDRNPLQKIKEVIK